MFTALIFDRILAMILNTICMFVAAINQHLTGLSVGQTIFLASFLRKTWRLVTSNVSSQSKVHCGAIGMIICKI